MLALPLTIVVVLEPFAVLFTRPTWAHAQVLVIGALLEQGPRTVTAALRAMGRSGERRFERYHRVLNRARWSGLRGAQILLGLLLALLPHCLPIVMVIDETLERRFGPRLRGVSGCGALQPGQGGQLSGRGMASDGDDGARPLESADMGTAVSDPADGLQAGRHRGRPPTSHDRGMDRRDGASGRALAGSTAMDLDRRWALCLHPAGLGVPGQSSHADQSPAPGCAAV